MSGAAAWRSVSAVARGVLAAVLFAWTFGAGLWWLLAQLPAIVAAVTGLSPSRIGSTHGHPAVVVAVMVLTPMTGALLGGHVACLVARRRAPFVHAGTVGLLLALLVAAAARRLTPPGVSAPAWAIALAAVLMVPAALAGAAFARWLAGPPDDDDG